MGQMLDLTGAMAMATAQPDNLDKMVQDALHCLTHFGTRDLSLEILHRIEGVFAHRGPYRRPDEVWGRSLGSQWIYASLCDSHDNPDPAAGSTRSAIALKLLEHCRNGARTDPLTPGAFMAILSLGYAFAQDQVRADVGNNQFTYPQDSNGRPCFLFERPSELLETLRENYDNICFSVRHPGGSDELSRVPQPEPKINDRFILPLPRWGNHPS